jgi:molybdopterin converting factor subunit 1
MNTITVAFFAHIRIKAGVEKVSLEIPDGTTVAGLKTILKDKFPALGPQLVKVMVLVNKKHIYLDDQVVPEGVEVAFLPPLSGG